MKPNKVYSGSTFGSLLKQYCDDKGIKAEAKMGLSNKQQAALSDAIKSAQECEIDTGLWTSLTVAQWAIESGYGEHCPGNNPFGITYSSTSPASQLLWTHEVIPEADLSGWKKEHPELVVESVSGDRVTIKVQRKFAAYPDLKAAFVDHARLLTTGRPYVSAWGAHKGDTTATGYIDAFAHVYATDPNYAAKLKATINELGLERFNHSSEPMKVSVTA